MIGVFIAKKNIANSFEALNHHNLSKFMSAWRDDGVFIYPGEIPERSGTFKGRDAVEGWFRNFLDQFPKIQFDIQNICVRNIFDITGTNVVAVHWNIQLTNRDGTAVKNNGVTIVNIKGGKAFLVKDFIFDQSENFKLGWGAV
jgi:ketosteroid isomerase-like protein